MNKIAVMAVSLGCPKNEIDGEHILYDLINDNRFCPAESIESADAVVINTCAFIEAAKKEAIDAILDACELKETGRLKVVVVTGCLSERYKDELLAEIPEIDVSLGIGSNDQIAEAIIKALGGEKVSSFAKKEELRLSHPRLVTTPKHYAYIKIADGCDNYCSYCAIPYIRGRFRSRPIEEICKEAEKLYQNGAKELIVIAQDTTRYGEDIYGSLKLPELLKQLAKIGFLWIRTLYCYPERITDELIDTIASEPSLLPYFDIPIQHCNDYILKKMNRKVTGNEIKTLLKKIRSKIPNAVIRTSLIAGFPGETEEQFEELKQFVKDVEFDRLGCFAYSQEEGTTAGRMDGQLSDNVKRERADSIQWEQQQILEKKAEKQMGKTISVICEEETEDGFIGRSEADAPEIDCLVYFSSSNSPKVGDLVSVEITSQENGDLIGKQK